MAIQATVNAQGNNTTRVYPNQSGPPTVLQPGSNLQITSPTDVGVDAGGVASIVTSDGSSVGVGPGFAFSLYTPGTLPSLNPWELSVSDSASGWAFRFSNLSRVGDAEVDIGAPNAADGLAITAPDNTVLTITDGAFQNSTIVPTWVDSGNGEMKITTIVITIEDSTQYTWTLGSGWSGAQSSPI